MELASGPLTHLLAGVLLPQSLILANGLMPSNTSKKIELLANIAIVVVALLFVAAFVKNYVLSKPTGDTNPIVARKESKGPPATDTLITPGSKLSVSNLSDLKLASSRRTLILALSNTCHFCTESAPFYKRLAQNRRSTRLVAVLPQSVKESQAYLTKLGFSVDEVTQLNLAEIGVLGTPTVVLVDNQGVIQHSWVGKLSPDKERAVLNALQEN